MSDQFDYIKWQKKENVGYLTLNRPDKMNSITEDMSAEMQEALQQAIYDTNIRCLLITGSGKAFCAGQNLSEITEKWEDNEYELGETVRTNYIPLIRMIVQMEKPVICGLNGVAAGAGANLALSCDILTASENASMIQAFQKLGLIPDSGGTYLLPRLVGIHRAKQLMMLDEQLSAQKAREWGLIYEVYDDTEFLDKTKNLARRMAGMPTRGLALTKKALNQSFQNSLEQQLEVEAELQSKAGQTKDFYEGVQAFLDKRKPDFNGE